MELCANVRRSPFARLLLVFMLGIYVSSLFHDQGKQDFLFFPVVLLIISMILMLLVCRTPGYNTNWHTGVVAALALFILGFICMNIHYRFGVSVKSTTGSEGVALIDITEPPVITEKSVKATAKIICWHDQKTRGIIKHQKFIVFFHKDSLSERLTAGNRVIAAISLANIESPRNPGEFDYQNYMAARGIYNRTYIPSDKWILSGMQDNHSMKTTACKIQKHLLKEYEKIGLNKTQYSILSALTLGYKNDLETHTKQVFSEAGVMHVMALSGFNVAVIAFLLGYILVFSDSCPQGSIIKTILIIMVIWLFAFVTGLSASVTRAALMISLVMTGKLIHRRINTINILYVSAFVLLTISPALLGDVSFQLSFAAVLGIVVFQPAMYRLFTVKYLLLRKLWQLFTVSCAAQLSTMPLTLFYFHQFPVYFWLTNLYVVPLVSLIICVAGIFLMVSFFDPLMMLVGKILSFLLNVLYQGISFTEMLPFALIKNIRINEFQVVLLAGILFMLGFFTFQKKRYLILIALSFLLIFQVVNIFRLSLLQNQNLVMVTNCGKGPIINFIYGRNCILLSDNNLSAGDHQLKYSLEKYWIEHGVAGHIQYLPFSEADIDKTSWHSDNVLLDLSGFRIMILNDNNFEEFNVLRPLKIDLLLVTGKVSRVMNNLPDLVNPEYVVIDPTAGYYLTKKWVALCQKWKRDCWVVARQGAFLSVI